MEIGRIVALAASRPNALRQSVGERLAGEGPIASAFHQIGDGCPQSPFDQRLGHQGMNHIDFGGAPTDRVIGQAALDQRDLMTFGRRQVLAVWTSIAAGPVSSRLPPRDLKDGPD